jgi:hypothetical protein
MTSRRRSNLSPSKGDSSYHDDEDDDGKEALLYHGDVIKPSVARRLSTFANRYTPSVVARIVNPTTFVMVLGIFLSHVAVGSAVYWWTTHGSHICPSNIIEYINWSGSNVIYQGQVAFRENRIDPYDSLVRIHPPSVPKKMEPVPPKHRKTFYYDGKKISQPIARAYRSRGWTQVDGPANAQWIYTYNSNGSWGKGLQKWQRFNWTPDYQKWNSKAEFAYYYKQFERKTKRVSQYVPETYMLSDSEEDALQFQQVLEQGGAKYPWVLKAGRINQGKGITMMAPNSKELMELPKKALRIIQKDENDEHSGKSESEDGDWEDMIVQKYVCNEMTWGRRKFDVRMYWIVASLDPLIILYHDGYVRIGNSDYSEEDFTDTRAHLTTHTFLGAEGKATFDEFAEMLDNFWERKRSRSGRGNNPYPWPAKTPVEHVRNQFKDALAEMVEVYRKEAFDAPDGERYTGENGFSFCTYNIGKTAFACECLTHLSPCLSPGRLRRLYIGQ